MSGERRRGAAVAHEASDGADEPGVIEIRRLRMERVARVQGLRVPETHELGEPEPQREQPERQHDGPAKDVARWPGRRRRCLRRHGGSSL